MCILGRLGHNFRKLHVTDGPLLLKLDSVEFWDVWDTIHEVTDGPLLFKLDIFVSWDAWDIIQEVACN